VRAERIQSTIPRVIRLAPATHGVRKLPDGADIEVFSFHREVPNQGDILVTPKDNRCHFTRSVTINPFKAAENMGNFWMAVATEIAEMEDAA